jgi:L-cysteine S-thiosulfotransferase
MKHQLIFCTALTLACAALAQSPTSATSSIQRGFALMSDQRSGNCAACHSIPDAKGNKSGIQSSFAPPLDGVSNRYTQAQLMQWIVDARVIKPHTLMPPFGVNLNTATAQGRLLTDAQIADVVAALETLR